MKYYIDLFAIKILCLLMCRGTPKIKAKLLAELVLNENIQDLENDNNLIGDSLRLKRAFKLLVYFSEIFPKKF